MYVKPTRLYDNASTISNHFNHLAGQKKSNHPDDKAGHPFPVVWKLFMQWLERILDHASKVIGTQIYPGIYDTLL